MDKAAPVPVVSSPYGGGGGDYGIMPSLSVGSSSVMPTSSAVPTFSAVPSRPGGPLPPSKSSVAKPVAVAPKMMAPPSSPARQQQSMAPAPKVAQSSVSMSESISMLSIGADRERSEITADKKKSAPSASLFSKVVKFSPDFLKSH